MYVTEAHSQMQFLTSQFLTSRNIDYCWSGQHTIFEILKWFQRSPRAWAYISFLVVQEHALSMSCMQLKVQGAPQGFWEPRHAKFQWASLLILSSKRLPMLFWRSPNIQTDYVKTWLIVSRWYRDYNICISIVYKTFNKSNPNLVSTSSEGY